MPRKNNAPQTDASYQDLVDSAALMQLTPMELVGLVAVLLGGRPGSLLSDGGQGIVFDLQGGPIVKITTDNAEAEIAYRLLTKEIRSVYLPEIYEVYWLPWLHSAAYVIVREDVPDLPKAIQHRCYKHELDLDNVVRNIRNRIRQGLFSVAGGIHELLVQLAEQRYLVSRCPIWADMVDAVAALVELGYLPLDLSTGNLGVRADGRIIFRDLGMMMNWIEFDTAQIPVLAPPPGLGG